MNRFRESGAHVDCCRGAEIVPPVTGISYQRTCATFGVPPLPIVCVSQSDSRPFRFVYWFCIITRYESVSMLLPSFSGTLLGPVLKLATPAFVGRVTAERDGVVHSTWT